MNWEVMTYTVYDLSSLMLDNLLVEDEIINNEIDILILKKTFKDYVSFCISGIIKLLSRFWFKSKPWPVCDYSYLSYFND